MISMQYLHHPKVGQNDTPMFRNGNMIAEGINVLTKELIETAPEYFNFYTRRGRAALVAAHLIAGGEFTGVLPAAVDDPSLLYRYMGGSKKLMRGWAQFNTYYWNPSSKDRNTRMTYDARTYNCKVGMILYGEQPKPTGKRYFRIDDFANLLEAGHFKTGDEVRAYLAKHFSINDWQGLHERGNGASRIRTHRIGEQSLAMVYGSASTLATQHQNRQPSHGGSSPTELDALEPILVNHDEETKAKSSSVTSRRYATYGLFQKVGVKGKEQLVFRGNLVVDRNEIISF